MSSAKSFDPTRDIPSLESKVILVTGATAGLGKQSVIEFAKHNPAKIWFAARSESKARQTIDEVKAALPKNNTTTIEFLQMDLASLASVYKAATKVIQSSTRLDILLNNGGIMAHPAALSEDGYEIQFATNFLGHALLTRLLLPLLSKTSTQSGGSVHNSRLICLSSGSHKRGPAAGIDFSTLNTSADAINAVERYGQSKLANILYAKELAARYPDVTVASANPGMVNTGLTSIMARDSLFYRVALSLARPIMGVPVEDGVRNQLWAAVSPDVVSGEFYSPVGVTGKGSPLTNDAALRKKLWDWTQGQLDAFVKKIEAQV